MIHEKNCLSKILKYKLKIKLLVIELDESAAKCKWVMKLVQNGEVGIMEATVRDCLLISVPI